ncbi:MAG: hypothetical protein LBG45_08705 [Dysgonamonadaceae bacterium]|jgi:hypothetical protein|nr:hypothetical protein [Dysgonamonadaceae bacterium]
MKLAIKITILFLIIFRFRLPVLFDTTILAMILSSLYYLFTRRALPFTCFFNRYVVTVMIGLLLLVWIVMFITVAHRAYDFFLLKIFGFQAIMLVAMIYAMPLLLEDDEEHAFERASLLVCYAFAVQGFIYLLGFFIPPFGDFLISMKQETVRDTLLSPTMHQAFRGYALAGTIFFELPAGIGVTWILLVRLLTKEDQTWITGYKPYLLFVLFFIESMFSGRTAFIGLLMAAVMGFLLIRHSLARILKSVAFVAVFAGLLAVAYAYVPDEQKMLLEEDIFPYAFEAWYTYEETGKVATRSSDALIHGHYYRLPDRTLLCGEGKFSKKGGGFYGDTDAGYMRNALFGGIPYILCLVIYQWLYFYRPLTISGRLRRTKEGYGDFMCFLTLFLYIFVLEYKGSALGIMNILEVLLFFICFSYMMRYYRREDAENP